VTQEKGTLKDGLLSSYQQKRVLKDLKKKKRGEEKESKLCEETSTGAPWVFANKDSVTGAP